MAVPGACDEEAAACGTGGGPGRVGGGTWGTTSAGDAGGEGVGAAAAPLVRACVRTMVEVRPLRQSEKASVHRIVNSLDDVGTVTVVSYWLMVSVCVRQVVDSREFQVQQATELRHQQDMMVRVPCLPHLLLHSLFRSSCRVGAWTDAWATPVCGTM